MRAVRFNGNYGYETVPNEIQALATMLVSERILLSGFSSSLNGNYDSVSVADISLTKNGSGASISLKQIQEDIQRQWDVVGRMYTMLI